MSTHAYTLHRAAARAGAASAATPAPSDALRRAIATAGFALAGRVPALPAPRPPAPAPAPARAVPGRRGAGGASAMVPSARGAAGSRPSRTARRCWLLGGGAALLPDMPSGVLALPCGLAPGVPCCARGVLPSPIQPCSFSGLSRAAPRA